MREVPILLTYDIHIHARHSATEVDCYLRKVIELHEEWGIKATFLFPAEAARLMKETVRLLLDRGHEIGCHGLTHRKEYYDLMPAALQGETLRRATCEIEDVIGQHVRSFRAPVFRITGSTLSMLEQLGYEADLSINSQRLGIFGSDPLNFSWMTAPRTAYHPDLGRPWRRGASRIWEIPLSCFLVPFMINTGLVFGSTFMRLFLWALHCESSSSVGKSIVYMTHPEDLCRDRRPYNRVPFAWRDLLPSRRDGLRFRHSLYETDAETIADMSTSLVRSMLALRARFLTAMDYVALLNRQQPRPA